MTIQRFYIVSIVCDHNVTSAMFAESNPKTSRLLTHTQKNKRYKYLLLTNYIFIVEAWTMDHRTTVLT